MIITQEKLITKIAKQEGMNAATVRKIFKSAEDIILNCLSSTTSSESTVVKLIDGLSLEFTQAEMVEIATKNGVATAEAEELLRKIGITATEEGQVAVKSELLLLC